MAGLSCLSHAFKTSDEETVQRWLENPYHQYFCGEEYFCHELPIDPSSLSRFLGRIGEKGCELLLSVMVQAGLTSGAVRPAAAGQEQALQPARARGGMHRQRQGAQEVRVWGQGECGGEQPRQLYRGHAGRARQSL